VTAAEEQSARAITALAATLGLAAVGWVVAVRQMDGMDMGVATELGSFASFIPTWVAMMAAMMLPGALPAVLRRARAGGRGSDALVFVTSYLVVWSLVGVVVYVLYRPHGSSAAVALAVGAGLYELTPLARACRRRCRARAGSGLAFGIACVGSSLGPMLVLLAFGPMSVTWMVVATGLVLAEKLAPPGLPGVTQTMWRKEQPE
jgi:predicted metal-binding membrane protein